MIDDEDPEALDAYDKHLSRHMRLLNVERVRSKRARSQSEQTAASIGRLLNLVEVLARRFRLNLETQERAGESVSEPMLDLAVRLIEFCHENGETADQYVPRILIIFNKQMDKTLSSLEDKEGDGEFQVELLKRCFAAVEAPISHRQPRRDEVRMVARTASTLNALASRNAAHVAVARAGYELAWNQFAERKSRFWTPLMFHCGLLSHRAIAELLVSLGVGSLRKRDTSPPARAAILETLHTYIPALREMRHDAPEAYEEFWAGMSEFVEEASGAEQPASFWKYGRGVDFLLRILDAGLSNGDVKCTEQVDAQVARLVGAVKEKMPRKDRRRLERLAKVFNEKARD
jgi:hypothetical protein